MKFYISILLFITLQVHAISWQENKDISHLFTQTNTQGTFVLLDTDNDQLIGYNQKRAETRFVPASTFKILNTLIGLESHAVNNVDEILPYGDKPQPIKSWEQDMSLRQAIKASNAVIYQELARRVGLKTMSNYVSLTHYGNQMIGNKVDRFWLDGPLKISAIEQIHFLKQLTDLSLPFTKANQKIAQDVILLEQGDDWTLYGKTGWENAPELGVGWFVGWVEKKAHIYPFALNLDIQSNNDIAKRIDLSKASLKTLGLL